MTTTPEQARELAQQLDEQYAAAMRSIGAQERLDPVAVALRDLADAVEHLQEQVNEDHLISCDGKIWQWGWKQYEYVDCPHPAHKEAKS